MDIPDLENKKEAIHQIEFQKRIYKCEDVSKQLFRFERKLSWVQEGSNFFKMFFSCIIYKLND